jgi:hypothetical protein
MDVVIAVTVIMVVVVVVRIVVRMAGVCVIVGTHAAIGIPGAAPESSA